MEAKPELSALENVSRGDHSGYERFVTLKNPATLWTENWFGVVLEFTVLSLFIQACYHASRRGEKAVFLMVTLVIAALGIELLQQIPHDGYELWWYHESVVNLMRHKVPLYVLCLFAVIYYYTDYVNREVNLPVLTQSFANACGAMLATFPCLVLAPNLLLMIFHFDDTVFRDRIYNVPFSELTYLFLLFFHVGHLYNTFFDEIEIQDRQFIRLLRCALQSGLVSAAYSLIEFYLLYVVFKLIGHKSVAYCLLFVMVTLSFMAKDEIIEKVNGIEMKDFLTTIKRKEWTYLVAFFLIVSTIPMFVNPENLKSTGTRLEFGPCDTIHAVSNMSPLESYRRRYVCPNGTERFGFDFHCVPELQLTSEVKERYTICGVAFDSPQLCKHLVLYSAGCLGFFYFLFSLNVSGHSTQPAQRTKKVE